MILFNYNNLSTPKPVSVVLFPLGESYQWQMEVMKFLQFNDSCTFFILETFKRVYYFFMSRLVVVIFVEFEIRKSSSE